jgi:YggT family protein
LSDLACNLLTLYWLVLLARVISSWFPPPQSPAGRQAISVLWTLTEPVIRPFRGLFPPVRMGGAALDLSVFAPFIAIMILRAIIC